MRPIIHHAALTDLLSISLPTYLAIVRKEYVARFSRGGGDDSYSVSVGTRMHNSNYRFTPYARLFLFFVFCSLFFFVLLSFVF